MDTTWSQNEPQWSPNGAANLLGIDTRNGPHHFNWIWALALVPSKLFWIPVSQLLGFHIRNHVSSYWLRFTTVFWGPFLGAIYCPREPFVGHVAAQSNAQHQRFPFPDIKRFFWGPKFGWIFDVFLGLVWSVFFEVFLGLIRGSFSHQNFVCFSWSCGLLFGSHFGFILGANILTKNIGIQTWFSGRFSEPIGASFEVVWGAPRHPKIAMIFGTIFGPIFRQSLEPLGSSFSCLFPRFFGSSFGTHLQGVREGPGGSFSLTLSMKTKVPLLSLWLSLDLVFGVKISPKTESKRLAKLVKKISSKILQFWFPPSLRHGAQKASKIALEDHWKFDAVLGARILA